MLKRPDVLPGTIDLVILRALSAGTAHGYGITRLIQSRSHDRIQVEGAALYQALHRLERRRLITSEWGVSENNRRAKYYRLTPAGARHLRTEATNWHAYVEAVSAVLAPSES